MAKPTVLPEFATQDLIDPTSGQNNVVEPNQALKDNGWNPFRVRPIRNVMNWLHRHTYTWLKYLDEEFVPDTENLYQNGSVDAKVNFPDFITLRTFEIRYAYSEKTINGGSTTGNYIIHLFFPQIHEGIGTSGGIQIYPNTTWPQQFVVGLKQQPFLIIEGYDILVGSILFPDTISAPFILYAPDRYNAVSAQRGVQIPSGFVTNNIGWELQTVSAFTETPITP